MLRSLQARWNTIRLPLPAMTDMENKRQRPTTPEEEGIERLTVPWPKKSMVTGG